MFIAIYKFQSLYVQIDDIFPILHYIMISVIYYSRRLSQQAFIKKTCRKMQMQ